MCTRDVQYIKRLCGSCSEKKLTGTTKFKIEMADVMNEAAKQCDDRFCCEVLGKEIENVSLNACVSERISFLYDFERYVMYHHRKIVQSN